MLRIHFTAADLTRVRIAGPDPLWEIALSMHVLRTAEPDPLVLGWKQQSSRLLRSSEVLKGQLALASLLNPPVGFFPDFLTPAESISGIDAGFEALLRTPKTQLMAEVTRLHNDRPRPDPVVADLSSGNTRALTALSGALRRYYETTIAPIWIRICTVIEADRAMRGRWMAEHGLAAVLDNLAPLARFQGDTLELLHYRQSSDLYLDGRGITLIPSYFKETPTLMTLSNPSLAPVLVYPVHRETRALAETQRAALATLMGRSRAAVLEEAAAGATVSQIAHTLGISQPSATKHLSVLRAAGLLTSMRDRNNTRHTLTSTGYALLDRR